MRNNDIYNLVTAATLLALGLTLPFLTVNNQELGNLLLPMHLPVLLCGFICGWKYGLAVGAITPLMRSLIISVPPLFPQATTMVFELAVYGFVTGFVYMIMKKRNLFSVYVSLISAMLLGRIVKGIANAICYGIDDKPYGFSAFIAGSFIEAIPGIILQLLFIPAVLLSLRKATLK